MKSAKISKISIWQYLALGYMAVILLGSGLLSFPFATRSGLPTSYVDALFTATSATCVTGLVPLDTNLHWSLFGQIVILCLIQFGGLGFMTFVSLIFGMVGKKLGIYQKKALMVSFGEEKIVTTKMLLKRILMFTFTFELIGAGVLSIRFIGDLGALKGIYYSIWHSISAFCNAGFDLFGGVFGSSGFVSLTHYATDPLVIITIAILIMSGGLGFCVWQDLFNNKFKFKKLQLHSHIILIGTAIVITISTALFYLFELKNPAYQNYNVFERLLVSFFSSVTPRTAGFNTTDLATLSNSSYLLTMFLMFVGAGTGSTAGGIKLNTFIIILIGMVGVFRKRGDITIKKRRISHNHLHQALAVFVSCLAMVVISTMIICAIEPSTAISFKEVLFECFSALGTVGLSLSITPLLSVGSQIIIMLLMYAGRVGILTLALAFAENHDSANIKYPLENLPIG